MKLSSNWSRSIVIALVLLLSGAGSVSATSGNPRRNQHKTFAAEPNKPTNDQHSEIPCAVLRSSEGALREALRTMKQQAEAAEKLADAYKANWGSPSVLVQIGLLFVGIVYSIFAGLQWAAINEQTQVAERAPMLLCKAPKLHAKRL